MESNNDIYVLNKRDLEVLLEEKFEKLARLFTTCTANNHAETNDELLTRKEAVRILKISYPTLHSWTNKKVIKSVKIQGRVYYLKHDLQRFKA